MTGVWYTSRESVKSALDEQETARSNAQIDDAIEQGARDVEGLCHRPINGFAPVLATKYFDWPSRTSRPPSWRVWLDRRELIELNSLTVGGGATTLTSGQYFLEPKNDGPPYDRIEINLGGSGAFSAGNTHQRAIAGVGLWGWRNDQSSIGSLASSLAGTVGATASVSWTTARFGVGDVLCIDSERMFIRERSFVDSTQDLQTSLTAADSNTTVAVSSGTAFALEEMILIDAERMRIVDIAGNNLIVKRAWDGSTLAAHSSGTSIYALTGVQLDRAQLSTSIAAHASDAVVYRWQPEPMLAALNRAYALNTLLQERAGYARVAGTGEQSQEFTGRGIKQLESDVLRIYGRKARTGAIT